MPQLRHGVKFETDGRTKLDIDAKVSEALLNAIRAAGGEIINSVPEENAVRAFLPVESAEAIAARPDVKFIRPASHFERWQRQLIGRRDTGQRRLAPPSGRTALGLRSVFSYKHQRHQKFAGESGQQRRSAG